MNGPENFEIDDSGTTNFAGATIFPEKSFLYVVFPSNGKFTATV